MPPVTGSASAAACPHLAAYDPLAPDELSDPYPTYAAARSATPAFRSERFGLWFISRYEDVVAAIRDAETFSSEFTGATLADFVPASRTGEIAHLRSVGLPDDSRFLLTTDPPVHHSRRKLAQQAFTPRRVAALESLIVDRSEELCDAIAGDEPIEIMGDFAYPLTTTVIAGILGVD